MMLTISQTAKLTGISVRTLHFYHQKGLLKPDYVDEQNGYRYYSEAALSRLQEILFYRELDFSLKEIQDILLSSNYKKTEALSRQKQLLLLKRQRIDKLIDNLESTLKGENTMTDFNMFDNTAYETAKKKYSAEVKEHWGNTDAYKESTKKHSSYSKERYAEINAVGNGIMNEFALCMKNGVSYDSVNAQALVKKWQDFITEYHYNCTKEILAGLGIMYVTDERFRETIDAFGTGNAEFMSKAIEVYCR